MQEISISSVKVSDAPPASSLTIQPEVTDETSSLLGLSRVDIPVPQTVQVQVEVNWHASVQALDHTRPRLYLSYRTGRGEERASTGTMGIGGKLLNLGKQAGSLAGQLLSGSTSPSPSGQPVKGDHICLLRVRVAEPGLDAANSTWLVTSVWEVSGGSNANLDIVSSTAFCLGSDGREISSASGLFIPVPSPWTADFALGNQRFLASGQFHWMRSRSRRGHGMKLYHQVWKLPAGVEHEHHQP